jgi:transposase
MEGNLPMFTRKEDMKATALREQGWSISAIARHLGRSRETVRRHLDGTRTAGERRRQDPDGFEPSATGQAPEAPWVRSQRDVAPGLFRAAYS